VLVLFVDASTINLRSLIREKGVPFRLLLIGLPLTMGFGLLAAMPLFENVSVWALALMAFILSPTDAALGQPVLTSPDIPENIKEAINVESGLNDGIALPPILACIAVLSSAAPERLGAQYWIIFTLKQFLFGPLLGALVGWIGGRFVDRASSAGWMNPPGGGGTSIALSFENEYPSSYLHGMPRKARLDAPGSMHHVMWRGIERPRVFGEDCDRDDFLVFGKTACTAGSVKILSLFGFLAVLLCDQAEATSI
jgi:NhaP-type Na+/H+ or K+/H+ antiporter